MLRRFLCTLVLLCLATVGGDAADQPNVVLVITDDQGYGDIAAHGNKMIQTPNMDKLHSESVRLTDYHVDPTCSPTRSALMSGRYSTRTGVWHTILGRSLMAPTEFTLAELFQAGGYKTGFFGKWHLGDNAPCRPHDQGFDHVVMHGGGGVGQTPDYWGNDYFDDTYLHADKWKKHTGYCTDEWFGEAMKFIAANKKKPFFVYLTTNAPHGPYNVAEKYSKPYLDKGVPATMAKFYGMITNIDENLGKLRSQLDELGLAENTIFIFTTDNGTAAGVGGRRPAKGKWAGFNAGMRGKKGSQYEGGHRVPFFVHWPKGGLTDGRDVDQLCAHVDVMPTLADLCGFPQKEGGPALDGTSLKSALMGDEKALRDRKLFVHSQRIQYPQKWKTCSVMTERWRLIDGKELYDIVTDPGQKKDVASAHPEVLQRLRSAYEGWWESLKPVFDKDVRIHLGSEAENPAMLNAMDWHCKSTRECPWNQGHIQRGIIGNGPWTVDVRTEGKYEITLYRWPAHLERAMGCKNAKLTIADKEQASKVKPSDASATFTVELPRGPTNLQTWLTREDGKTHGAYYVKVKLVR